MSMTLCHSDSCSGTTIMDDGTKVHWTEGYSEAVIIYTDGRKEVVGAHSRHPILQTPEIAEIATDEARQMTAEEEVEWDVAMN